MKLLGFLLAIVLLARQPFEAAAWTPHWHHINLSPSGGYFGSKWWVQWGNGTSTSDSSQSFSFATPFPTACVYVGINIKTANQAYQLSSNSWDTDGFTINRDEAIDGPHDFTYMALGYNSSAPDTVHEIYGDYDLGSTRGYVRLNTMEWMWGRNSSSNDTIQIFVPPDTSMLITDMGHAGLNFKESNVQTQLSFEGYNWGEIGTEIANLAIDRDAQIDGTNSFQYQIFGVNPARNLTTPAWNYEFWNDSTVVVNMDGLWVQTLWDQSDDNGTQYWRFAHAFPNVCFHVGVNMWVANYKTQLSVTGWNTTHFWINRSNDFYPSNVGVSFSMIAIGH